MLSRQFASAVLFGIAVLVLAACTSLPAPLIPPTLPVSPLPARSTAEGTPASAATTVQSPVVTPEAPQTTPPGAPAAGKSAMVGRLIDVKTGQPMVNQNLSLPSVICPPGVEDKDKREQCVYAVDEAFDPSAITDQGGRFVFQDIAAGDYVMIVGNTATRYTVLTNESNQPLIWSAKADQVLDVGDLVVDLK